MGTGSSSTVHTQPGYQTSVRTRKPGASPSTCTSTRLGRYSVIAAAITEYLPNRVEVHVEGDAPGFLVLTDVWYPGWVCTVDDEPVPIYRANHAFRAVEVPAGAHDVVFRFEPGSFELGHRITLGSLAAVTALLLILAVCYWPWCRRPLLLVLLALLFFLPLLLHPAQVLYSDYSDLLAEHIPAKRFLVRSFQETGELPLWCPYQFAGSPFVHDIQVAMFYPPHLALLLLPESWVGPALSWLRSEEHTSELQTLRHLVCR